MRIILVFLVCAFLFSCKKENDRFVTGTVIEQRGCYANSFLVAVDNPDYSSHSFLRPTILAYCVACYNCSNAVFVRLPGSFAAVGSRVKFLYVCTELSCLSASEAPNHIAVKNLSLL